MQKSGSGEARKTTITKDQIKIIHTLKSKLGLSDEDYRARVMAHSSGFEGSSLDMSYSEAKDLLKELEAEAVGKGVWNAGNGARCNVPLRWEHLGNRPGMASPAQLRMIEAMWRGVSYTYDPVKREVALRKFIFRICGKSAPEFVEQRDVSKLVNAMKNMRKG